MFKDTDEGKTHFADDDTLKYIAELEAALAAKDAEIASNKVSQESWLRVAQAEIAKLSDDVTHWKACHNTVLMCQVKQTEEFNSKLAAAQQEIAELKKYAWCFHRLSDDDNSYEMNTPYVMVDSGIGPQVVSGQALFELCIRTWEYNNDKTT